MKKLISTIFTITIMVFTLGATHVLADAPVSVTTCSTDALSQSRSIVHATYDLKRWQQNHPLGDINKAKLNSLIACLSSKEGQDLNDYKNKLKPDFFLYQKYRAIIPGTNHADNHCNPGPWGYFVIPCYIIDCESFGGNWMAHNPSSSAAGPYEIETGRIYPARTHRAQLQNHRRALVILHTQGIHAWSCA